MADTKFTDATASVPGTNIIASWLNDVNTNTYTILASVTGTNTITGTGALTVVVGYPRGVAFRFIPVNNNTGAVTINISGLGTKAITKYGTQPLVAGDLAVGSWAFITYDGTQFQLLNPLTPNVLETGRLLNTQTFLASGTYTPTAGTTRILVKLQGAGGAGGGSALTGAGQVSAGGGGGAGGYAETFLTSGFSGTAITVGVGGVGSSGATGGAGGSTSFGAFVTCAGGSGGAAAAAASIISAFGGAGSLPAGASIINLVGATGGNCVASTTVGYVVSGCGAASLFGGGAPCQATGGANAGIAATVRGAGGSGAAGNASSAAQVGGAGGAGLVIVYEYS